MTTIEIDRFTRFTVAADGERISLECIDSSGAPGAVIIAAEHLKQFMMTMPEMARQALRRKFRDPSLRLVYPVAAWELEAGTDGRVVMTLRTPDGFAIAFALLPERLQEIAATSQNPGVCSLRPN